MPSFHFEAAIAGPGSTSYDRFINRGISKSANVHDCSSLTAVNAFIQFLETSLGYDIYLFESLPHIEKNNP